MPFPTGVRIIDKRYHGVIPWAWGINGASSVLGSILALFIAITFGLKISFSTGIICYAAALVIIPKAE